MAGKLASRVGLSEAQFREAYGTEEQCRAAVEKLRWPRASSAPVRRHRGQVAQHPAQSSAGPAATRSRSPPDDLPRHQAAAHDLVPGHVAGRHRQERDQLGRAGPPARHQADQRLGAEAEVMHVMAGREEPSGWTAGLRWMTPTWAGSARGKRGRGAAGKPPFVAAVGPATTAGPGRSSCCRSRASGRARSSGGRQHLASAATVVSDGLCCWTAAAGPAGAYRHGHRRRQAAAAGHHSSGSTPRSATSRRRSSAPTAGSARPRRALSRQLRLAPQPPLPARDAAPALGAQRRRTAPLPYRLLTAGSECGLIRMVFVTELS